jgi:hypothetical protein
MIVVDVSPGGRDGAALPTAGPLFHRWGRGGRGGGGGEEVGRQGFRFVFIPEITSPFKLCIPCKKNCVERVEFVNGFNVADPDPHQKWKAGSGSESQVKILNHCFELPAKVLLLHIHQGLLL